MTSIATRLTFIRHGESNAQVSSAIVGHDTCTGLSDRGRQQAGALHDRLAATGELAPADAVYTSLLARAIETAAIIGPALGRAGGPVDAVRECDWCEIHPGSAEGLTFSELLERYPTPAHPRDPFVRRIPDGESWAEFFARVGSRIRRLTHEHAGQRVVIVAHGGVIGASFVALGRTSIEDALALVHEARNTSITEWRAFDGEWRLLRYNDAAHVPPGLDGSAHRN